MKTPLIIAHRGASAVAPENTIAAFRRAIEVGADGVEFDVRLARDGVPVVIHDSTLERTAGLKRGVSDLTSEELSQIDVGSWFYEGGNAIDNKRHQGGTGGNATVRERAALCLIMDGL
jgi:glycerophosphoryl diester phosphodiesterase